MTSTYVPNLLIEKARLERNLACGAYDLHMVMSSSPSGTNFYKSLGVSPTIQLVTPGEFHPPEPFVQLDHRSAQALFDALWAAGLRPSSGEQQQGANTERMIALMQDHLADLRRMVFGQERGPDTPTTTFSLPDHI